MMNQKYLIPLAPQSIWDYERRVSQPDDRLVGLDIAWDKRLVSDAGAHYHFFFPAPLESFGPDVINVMLAKCERAARNHGDVVSCSFEFLKEGV